MRNIRRIINTAVEPIKYLQLIFLNSAVIMRIVSLLPGATDTLQSLGVLNLLVARTHECDQRDVQNIPIVTSSKVGGCSLEECDVAMRSYAAGAGEGVWSETSVECLLQTNLAVYLIDCEKLKQTKPDIIFTQIQEIKDVLDVKQMTAYAKEFFENDKLSIVNLDAQNLEQNKYA
eukprot:TRINITY_DN3300_c0_g1_i5.p1 TRINITY_DN3300_c0_g1~~TRINITY_DN3300_c0_g1_i5.p1  ORF type:complete len:175 (+),score=17.45 TRINITY_DN3300_c0_g1_i5:2-526(+)